MPIFQLADKLSLWLDLIETSILNSWQDFSVARRHKGSPRRPITEWTANASQVTQAKQCISGVRGNWISQTTAVFPSKEMGRELRELDTSFMSRLRNKSSGTLVIAERKGIVLPLRNPTRLEAEDLSLILRIKIKREGLGHGDNTCNFRTEEVETRRLL